MSMMLVVFEEDHLALDPEEIYMVRGLDELDLDPRTGAPPRVVGAGKQARIDLRGGTWVYVSPTWREVLDRMDEAALARAEGNR